MKSKKWKMGYLIILIFILIGCGEMSKEKTYKSYKCDTLGTITNIEIMVTQNKHTNTIYKLTLDNNKEVIYHEHLFPEVLATGKKLINVNNEYLSVN
jgi:uncharacterized lipoprotein NlpE involved in copper resistance